MDAERLWAVGVIIIATLVGSGLFLVGEKPSSAIRAEGTISGENGDRYLPTTPATDNVDMQGFTINNLGQMRMEEQESRRLCASGKQVSDKEARMCVGETCTQWRRILKARCPPPDLSAYTPYIFARTGSGMKAASDFLFGSPTTFFDSSEEGLKAYRQGNVGGGLLVLPVEPEPSQGRYILEMKEVSLERAFIDAVSFSRVSHPPGTEVVVEEDYDEMHVLPAEEMQDLVEPAHRQEENILSFDSRGAGFLLIRSLQRQIGNVKPINISYRHNGSWEVFAEVKPRYPNAVTHLVELPPTLKSPFELKLSGWRSFSKIQKVGILREFSPQPYTETRLPLYRVENTETGVEKTGLLTARDEEFVTMETGESYRLIFMGGNRTDSLPETSFVLRSHGFYTDIEAEDRRTTSNTLRIENLTGRIRNLERKISELRHGQP